MKKSHLALSFSLFTLTISAQESNLTQIDLQLSKMYDGLRIADWEAKDSLLKSFTNKLYATLATPQSFSHPFDSLSTKILRRTSPNNKINIWSWDKYTGGSWHQNMTAVQFRTEDGKLGFRQLNSGEEAMLGGYTDVYILEIFEIEDGGEVYYLTFGRGTHGSGNYHRIAQVFYLKDNKFIKCDPCFEGESDLVLEAWRGDEIELEFEPNKNEINHTALIQDDITGRYLATDKIIKWKFRNGNFRKSN